MDGAVKRLLQKPLERLLAKIQIQEQYGRNVGCGQAVKQSQDQMEDSSPGWMPAGRSDAIRLVFPISASDEVPGQLCT